MGLWTQQWARAITDHLTGSGLIGQNLAAKQYHADRVQFCLYRFNWTMGNIISRFGYDYRVMANNYQEALMNKDQIKGHVEEAKGKVKEVTGKILDDKGMEIEENVQKNAGKVQAGFGDLKEDIKEGK